MVLPYYLRHFLKPEIYGTGYRGMLKQGMYEAPYLTMSLIGLPVPFFTVPYVLYRFNKIDGYKKRYLMEYTVMRPGDPRLDYFHCQVDRTKPSKK